MTIKIIHCPIWKDYVSKVASYAAAIRKELDQEPVIETGSRGQYDVLVDEKKVISRKGGLLAMIMKKHWPSDREVTRAILTSQYPVD